MEILHGTSIEYQGVGVLIMGESGAGKSDLALQMLERGGQLVADDYTEINQRDGQLQMRAPKTTKGLLEIRGLGLVAMDKTVDTANLGLLVRLTGRAQLERLPEHHHETLMGQEVALLHLSIEETSAASKFALACRLLAARTWPPMGPAVGSTLGKSE